MFSSPRIRINDYIIEMFPDLDDININYNVLIFNIKSLIQILHLLDINPN